MSRVYNFSAGPACLPEEVLKEAAADMLDYKGCGMSVMEMSHRSKMFQDIIDTAEADLRDLMGIPENYRVLFLQGGGCLQFADIPMNLMHSGKADYIVSGSWSKKAFAEAKMYGNPVCVASSEDKNFSYVPKMDDIKFSDDADYVYICQNETIFGNYMRNYPKTDKPLINDVSSCFLSEPLNVNDFGVIWGGVQKNIGPAGAVIVIIRDDLVSEEVWPGTPKVMRYKTQVEKGSMYNTPPCWTIYMCGLVFKHLKGLGGLEVVKANNEEKAALLYDYLDASDMFHATVVKEDRSLMNVPFITGNPELDAKFVAESAAAGLMNLKGHRDVGGLRASIYNAMPKEGVAALVDFMKKFELANK